MSTDIQYIDSRKCSVWFWHLMSGHHGLQPYSQTLLNKCTIRSPNILMKSSPMCGSQLISIRLNSCGCTSLHCTGERGLFSIQDEQLSHSISVRERGWCSFTIHTISKEALVTFNTNTTVCNRHTCEIRMERCGLVPVPHAAANAIRSLVMSVKSTPLCFCSITERYLRDFSACVTLQKYFGSTMV